MQQSVEKKPVVLERLVVEHVPIESLAPNDYNPNRQSEYDFELLCKSIEEDGFTQPVIALRETRTIVDGEHRWRACRALKHAEIPVVFTDMTPAQAKIATLRHNRARGDEDVQLAAAVLKDLVKLGATDWVKDSLSLDSVELDNFMHTVDDQDGFTAAEAEKIAEAGDESLRAMVREEGGDIEEHETVSVQDVIRAREGRLAGVHGEEERAARMEDATNVYRLKLVFTGEEAKIIKGALGDNAIDRLLEICRERRG